MSVAIDERTRRQARARALAASILDSPHLPRRFSVGDVGALRGTARRRLHRRPAAALPVPSVPRRFRRRHVAALVLAVQVLLLVSLLLLPTFSVRSVEVGGTHLLTRASVLRVAGLGGGRQSIFTVDGEGARRRLAALPWVLSVSVETELPATVRVSVVERAPVLRVRRQDGDLVVAAGGAVLPAADAQPGSIPPLPVLVDDRPVPSRATPPPLDPTLLGILADAAARFPATYGCAVSAFRWQPDGLLTIVAVPGWKAIIGHADSPDRVAEIPDQLAALASLRGRLDFAHPSFGYVDLEDPAVPAVGGRPGAPLPAPAFPAPSAAPSPTPTPTPTPVASPSASAPTRPAASAGAASPTPIGVPIH